MKIECCPIPMSSPRRRRNSLPRRHGPRFWRRGRFNFAVIGGRTPWLMLRALASENIPWNEVHLMQVDERVAPAGHILTAQRLHVSNHHGSRCRLERGNPRCRTKTFRSFQECLERGAPPRVSLTAGQCPAQSGFEDGRLF
jgi:hypothetical protein